MATFQGIQTVTRESGSTISPYRFVVFAADGQYDHAGAQGKVDGVSAEGVTGAGKAFPMILPTGCIVKVEAGAAITINASVASDGSGRVITAVSGAGNYTCGTALQAANNAGEIIEVQFLVDRDQA